jgi:hypothetical protein
MSLNENTYRIEGDGSPEQGFHIRDKLKNTEERIFISEL